MDCLPTAIKRTSLSILPLQKILLLLLALALGGCHENLYVHVKTGWLKGLWADDVQGGTRVFLGIPYARPPLGNLRFAAPQPAEPWHGVRDVVNFGASCVQRAGALAAPGAQSEDCLTLNVYAPGDIPRGGAPVMVFIHGGAFIAGGSSQYNGARLSAEGKAVVVTLNYRLGALGFMAPPATDTSAFPVADNAGLRDQQLALRWVRENIHAFGGDANNVTLLGESAGSASTCVQIVAPGSAHLADKFILQSGVCTGGLSVWTLPQAQAVSAALSQSFCAEAGDALTCLREAEPLALMEWGANAGIFGAGWSPTIVPDSDVLPAAPAELIAAGQYNQGPLLVGTNKYEWGLFQAIGMSAPVTSVAQLAGFIDLQYGAAAPLLKAEYLPAGDAQANGALVRLLTDAVFRCPTRSFARQVQAQGSPVWLYSFDQGLAFHAMELPYVFGNPSALLAPVLVEPLRATVQGYWTAFAAHGDPNGVTAGNAPFWPQHDASDQHMVLRDPATAGVNLAQTSCDLWDALLAAPVPAE